MCLHSSALCFITGPFPPPNTRTEAGDKECTHPPLYTTSHLSEGNWKEEEKGGERGEVRRMADEGEEGPGWGEEEERRSVCLCRYEPGAPAAKVEACEQRLGDE